MNIEFKKYVKENITYYKKALKKPYNQPKNQDERFIHYLVGKLHAYSSMMKVIREIEK